MKIYKFKFRVRELGVVTNVTYTASRSDDVSKQARLARKALLSELRDTGRDSALKLWSDEIHGRVLRSGGRKSRGQYISKSARQRGANTRGA